MGGPEPVGTGRSDGPSAGIGAGNGDSEDGERVAPVGKAGRNKLKGPGKAGGLLVDRFGIGPGNWD